MIILGGLDEAGYGPKLGPLVISGAILRAPGEAPFWDLLADGVSREERMDGRVVVQDSKLRHPGASGLRKLEETVWPFLRLAGIKYPVSSRDLIRKLGEGGEARGAEPWYGEGSLKLPLAAGPKDLDARTARLQGAMKKTRAEFPGFRCRVIEPVDLNRGMTGGRNKADFHAAQVGKLLTDLHAAGGEGSYRVDVDKLGGRAYYTRPLVEAFPGWGLLTVSEDSGRSQYRLLRGKTRLEITFSKKADREYGLVALASCLSKYLRELSMILFNRWWAKRVEGLKPTAGYPGDADRFLKEIRTAILENDVKYDTLVRAR